MDAELREALDRIRQDLTSHIDASAAETRTYVDAGLAENRRHSEVIAENLDGKIQQVAGAVVALSERLDRVEANLREEILRSQRELSAMIRFSYAELDRKVQALAARAEDMEARLQRLESRG